MRANRELLLHVLATIKHDLLKWKQSSWVGNRTTIIDWSKVIPEGTLCKTAYCFAGHAAVACGWPDFPTWFTKVWAAENGYDLDRLTFDNLNDAENDWYNADPEDADRNVEDFARKKLGLSHYWADILFDGDNTLEDIERIIEEILREDELKNA